MKKPAPESQRIVVQYGDCAVKGYLESPSWTAKDHLLGTALSSSLETIRLRLVDSDAVEEISTRDAKAVFYVRSFEGNSENTVVNFYSRAAVADGIWMRLQFRDGEVMEGIAMNSLRYLVQPGFFIMPTAPDTNNELVYVVKNWLVDHRVLGLRNAKFFLQTGPELAASAMKRI